MVATSRLVVMVFVATLVLVNARYFIPSYIAASTWLANDEHRLPNVRILRPECREVFVRKFVDWQDWSKPTMLVLGDSQPYSAEVSLENTFPAIADRVAGLNLNIVNVSLIGATPTDITRIAEQATQAHAKLSLVNLNQAHFTEEMRTLEPYIPDVSRTPLEFERCVFAHRRMLTTTQLKQASSGKLRERFAQIPLSPARYDSTVDNRLETLIAAVKKTTVKSLVAYVTPNNIDAFKLYGYDVEKYKKTSEEMFDRCKKTKVRCFNYATVFSMKYFNDIVHLNTNGHLRLGALIGLDLRGNAVKKAPAAIEKKAPASNL